VERLEAALAEAEAARARAEAAYAAAAAEHADQAAALAAARDAAERAGEALLRERQARAPAHNLTLKCSGQGSSGARAAKQSSDRSRGTRLLQAG